LKTLQERSKIGGRWPVTVLSPQEGVMATIRKESIVRASSDAVWDAVRDVGQVHRRLCPGVLVDARMDGDAARASA
jgi:hypothetical protein